MAKNDNLVSRARGRKPAPVKKPFPVGFALGCLALALFLGGILTYAWFNQGLGDKSSLRYAQSQLDGLRSVKGASRNHKDGALSYPGAKQVPPIGGDHSDTPQSCQAYTEAIPNERALHSLEHGAVWITYQPSLAKKQVDELKKLAEGDPSRLLSPYPGLKKPISVQAWGEQIFADSTSDKQIKKFADLFTSGPQSPEKGAACQGSTATGPLAPVPVPVPSGSASPAASPSGSAKPSGPAKPSPTPSK